MFHLKKTSESFDIHDFIKGFVYKNPSTECLQKKKYERKPHRRKTIKDPNHHFALYTAVSVDNNL